jgi:hypothetical protein
MNLRWANLPLIYFPRIAPDMGRHCNVGHVIDPARPPLIPYEDAPPRLALTNQSTALAFDLMAPSNKGHIVGPGKYELDILVPAGNARPRRWTVTISLLPLLLQLIGRPFTEAMLHRVALYYEDATRWTKRHPAGMAAIPAA